MFKSGSKRRYLLEWSDLEDDRVKSLKRYACWVDSEQEIKQKRDGIVMQIGLSSLPQ
jgi:hypothetical protein